MEKYVANLSDRKILDVHKNVQVYAIVRIYQALGKKNGALYTTAENMKEYEYTVIADDSEFEKQQTLTQMRLRAYMPIKANRKHFRI